MQSSTQSIARSNIGSAPPPAGRRYSPTPIFRAGLSFGVSEAACARIALAPIPGAPHTMNAPIKILRPAIATFISPFYSVAAR